MTLLQRIGKPELEGERGEALGRSNRKDNTGKGQQNQSSSFLCH